MRPFLSTLDSQTQAEIENFEYLRSQKDAKLKDTIDTWGCFPSGIKKLYFLDTLTLTCLIQVLSHLLYTLDENAETAFKNHRSKAVVPMLFLFYVAL